MQLAQEKYTDLESFLKCHKFRNSGKIMPNLPGSIASDLSSMANELRLCGVDRYSVVERQLTEMLI
jgi:hypothetical protein